MFIKFNYSQLWSSIYLSNFSENWNSCLSGPSAAANTQHRFTERERADLKERKREQTLQRRRRIISSTCSCWELQWIKRVSAWDWTAGWCHQDAFVRLYASESNSLYEWRWNLHQNAPQRLQVSGEFTEHLFVWGFSKKGWFHRC